MEKEIQENFNYVVDDDDGVSDCESTDCESNVTSNDDDFYEEGLFFGDDLVELDKDDPIHNVIHNKFLSCLGDIGKMTCITAVHKKIWSNDQARNSKLRCFEIYRQGLKNEYGNDITMKYAWYGTSKENIARIMSSGFDLVDVPIYNGLFGRGIYLHPIDLLNQSVNSCTIDDDGLMHVMLCRVLVEREEIVTSYDSSKSQLDYENSNSGIDDDEDIVSPTMYIVKGNEMGTHILPEYIVSFKTTCLKGPSSSKTRLLLSKKPKSPWLPFSTLISLLPKLLPPRKVDLINKQYRHFKERKISRLELIKKLKRLVGVDLLATIVKLCGTKEHSLTKDETTVMT